ncbi:apoptosis-inducing factor 2 [Ceratobasidium sp. AG-Ba]|nr:apoptosis-inducing factor 2 [Ceratobasidium sp. AG-Ba]
MVMGASYGGAGAIKILASGLPNNYRLVVLERNSHANHLYVLPRYAVVAGHEDKAFVPYVGLFGSDNQPSRHVVVHGTITRLQRNSVAYMPAEYEEGNGQGEEVLDFEYAIYALGARLPAPIDLWAASSVFDEPITPGKLFNSQSVPQPFGLRQLGTKQAGIEWLKKAQRRLESVRSVLVVGGGALGIQFATDLKELYPSKSVTLLHSRERLLPRFSVRMHDEINKTMSDLGVNMLLGQRLDIRTTLPENTEYNENGERVVRTVSGRVIAADLVLLCTGQYPNTDLIGSFAPDVVDPRTGLVRVSSTLQLAVSREQGGDQMVIREGDQDLSHIFAIGDAADAFGAIKAGHTAWFQGEVAAKNILSLIKSKSSQLEKYKPGSPSIKVTLGMKRYVIENGPNEEIKVGEDGHQDLSATSVWAFWGANYDKNKGN